MAINVDKAFETDDGYAITDDSGNVVAYFCSGSGDPTGSPAPINSYYFDLATQLLHYKYGAADSDWRQIRAQDMLMDVSVIEGVSPDLVGDETVYDSISTLGLRVFGSFYGLGLSNPNFQTTSGTFQDALVENIPNPRAGTYLMFWRWTTDNSKTNTSNQTEARFNDLALVTYNTAGGVDQTYFGFGEFTILDLANLKLSVAIRRSVGNGTSRVNTMNIMAFRVTT